MTTTKNKKSSKKYYDLDTTWVDKLYPKISTKEKFLKYIKSVGEEYNEATGTGWKETNTSGVFDFYGNERSSLGGSRVRYWLLGEQLDYFEKGSNSVEDHSSFQTMNITLRDESGIFSFCKNDKIYSLNSKYDFYDLKSKTLLENEVILRVTNEVLDKVKEEFTEIRKSLKKEKKTAATSTAKTEVAKPEKAYSVSQTEEWMKEVFPKVETLENFNKYIKANNLEFNKETGTGWKLIYSNEIHTMMRYYKNHIEDDSNLGIKQVSFIPEKEASKAKLRYADKGSPESVVTGEYYGYSFIDPSDSTEYFVVHCNQEYFLIDRNGKRHTETFNKEENLLDSARVKFLHSKEEPEVQKPDKIQKYEDINGRWIKELYPQIETLEKFKRYIEEKGIVYNEKTKTGWRKAFTGPDTIIMEYVNKGFVETDLVHGIKQIYFSGSSNESESKLRSANSNRDRLYTKEGFQELESPSGDYFYVSNGKEKLIYDKNGNIQAGPFSTEEEVLKMFKKYVAERPNVLKLKLQEYIPKNYTGIVEWENGTKSWYKKEKFHREDGPAVEYSDGTKEWWVEGKQFISKEAFYKHSRGESKLVYTAKSDAREAAKRVAVNQISKFVQTLILNSVKASSTASSGLTKILDSENGRTALKFIISSAVPILKQHVLPKYGEILDEVAEEFRIQGETELVTGVVDKLIETMQTHSVFNKQLEERIRVQVETEMVKKLSPPSVELSFAEIENQSNNVYEIASKIK